MSDFIKSRLQANLPRSLIIFGNWVEQQRHIAGLTQAQAAKAAKITRVRWSQIATGKGGRPRAATAVRMAKAVNKDHLHALSLLRYPVDNKARRRFARGIPKTKTAKTVRAFLDIVQSPISATADAFRLMDVYLEYLGARLGSDYAHVDNPVTYETALHSAMALDPSSRYYLVRTILQHLWESDTLLILPNLPENKDYNRDQQKVLERAAKSLRELQIVKRLQQQSIASRKS
jgi:transcriptional regulator with XRE-family HTH domain